MAFVSELLEYEFGEDFFVTAQELFSLFDFGFNVPYYRLFLCII